MGAKTCIWVVLIVLAIVLVMGARYLPYFPGDVKVTRFVQSIAPAEMSWSKRISSTAEYPVSLILVVLTMAMSWFFAGLRAALAAMACFAGMWLVGLLLGPVIARPRPSPELVRVAEKLSGSSFPSIFALHYASTVGFLAVLSHRKRSGWLRAEMLITCCVVMLVGWTARIALGAHWPSDLILSYGSGFFGRHS
ncbi:MAG: phosphatase PAP2 family protein [Syntrophobacteraceae bacterium]